MHHDKNAHCPIWVSIEKRIADGHHTNVVKDGTDEEVVVTHLKVKGHYDLASPVKQ
jgi:hypothetical protein